MSETNLEKLKRLENLGAEECTTVWDMSENDLSWLIKRAGEAQELETFKNSVEYTVDTETIELIIENQTDERQLKLSEISYEKIYELQNEIERMHLEE